MTRPDNPNINIPAAFAVTGTKTDFTNEKIQNGFDPVSPEILAGDNLNKFIDDSYKGLNYSIDGVTDLYDVTDALQDLSNLSQTGQAIINNKANKDLSNLSITGNAHFANPSLSNLNSTGQAVIDSKANVSLDNLNTSGNNRLHALKGYLDKGELLTDSVGLADIKNYARSTFDGTKFTSVGTPTISTDGILTGISGTDYAKVSLSTSGTSILIKSRFLYSSSSVAGDVYSGSGNNKSPRLLTGGTNITAYITQSGTTASLAIAKSKLTDNTWYTTEHSISPTAQTFTIYDDAGNVIDTKSGTTAITVNVSTILATLNMGWYSSSEYFNSSIDLKGFQVYVDNTQVFNGNQTGTDTYTINGSTVTIPYVLSKTGSKIVDSAYRTDVASVYSALGYAPYYTLSDTDFTLPQGEIYGLMLNQSTPHIVESYENGKSGYIVYSNGLCKQWGYLATTSSSRLEYTATLFKTFKDTNYSFYRSTDWTVAASSYNDNFSSFYDVGYTAKTTSTVSFWMHENTYQNGTDWVAIGYIN